MRFELELNSVLARLTTQGDDARSSKTQKKARGKNMGNAFFTSHGDILLIIRRAHVHTWRSVGTCMYMYMYVFPYKLQTTLSKQTLSKESKNLYSLTLTHCQPSKLPQISLSLSISHILHSSSFINDPPDHHHHHHHHRERLQGVGSEEPGRGGGVMHWGLPQP